MGGVLNAATGGGGAEANHALNEVLDEALQDTDMEAGEAVAAETAVYEEHLARLKAEAEAQDKTNRLRVAQEQLAEYAKQKEQDAQALLQAAEAVQSAVSSALCNHASAEEFIKQVQELHQKLAEAAAEAQAFAAQQVADVESLKRSSIQAELPGAPGDVMDMKRPREAQDQAEAEEDPAAAPAPAAADAAELDGADALQRVLASSTPMRERAKYIPLRLSQAERRLLRLLEAALNVSEYTDKVDILTWRSKNQRVQAQIKDICAILSGLVVAQDYKRGQALVRDRNFKDNEDFFQDIFELGRRYKVMNPDKMRAEFGKLMYILMDSSEPAIQELLEFSCVRPLNTVASVLEAGGAAAMLDDPLMETATAEIVTAGRSRYEIQRDIKTKERAREVLAKRYRNARMSDEDLLLCIYSISDNNSFLLFNRDPIDRMISYLTAYFKDSAAEQGFSLAIQSGREGARLSHNHERQYHYVLQSLVLWREISTDMFKVWYLAAQDMLQPGNSYRLCDTGQGLNRVQSAPALHREMHRIVARCQQKIGSWVGSAVVHLGDHNVPNALMLLDKYSQVPRILNPVVLVLDELPKLCKDPAIRAYIEDGFGGVEECKKTILCDFFRHAFDGSGADSFFDAGSCIDGRLTSAWNWCSKIESKSYYPVFKLAGFAGFDGDFRG